VCRNTQSSNTSLKVALLRHRRFHGPGVTSYTVISSLTHVTKVTRIRYSQGRSTHFQRGYCEQFVTKLIHNFYRFFVSF
jgi:hypothetical protein